MHTFDSLISFYSGYVSNIIIVRNILWSTLALQAQQKTAIGTGSRTTIIPPRTEVKCGIFLMPSPGYKYGPSGGHTPLELMQYSYV